MLAGKVIQHFRGRLRILRLYIEREGEKEKLKERKAKGLTQVAYSQEATPPVLSPTIISMMEKAYSLFLCILLISVVFLPSTAAGRVLLHTAQTEDEGGHHGRNDGNKSAVSGSTSKPDSSKDGFSSPSEPIPTRQTAGQAVACSKSAYRDCLRPKNRGPPVPVCKPYNRSC